MSIMTMTTLKFSHYQYTSLYKTLLFKCYHHLLEIYIYITKSVSSIFSNTTQSLLTIAQYTYPIVVISV